MNIMAGFKNMNIEGMDCSMFECPERRAFFDNPKDYTKAKALLTVILSYCKSIFPTIIPSEIEITRCLLTDNENMPYDVVLKNYAYVMADYTENYLLKNITPDNIERYKDKITYLAIDFEYFCYDVEKECKGADLKPMHPTAGRRSCLSDNDIVFVAKSLFYIETVAKVEHMSNSDLPTVAISMLRLYIDRVLRGALPYKKIINTVKNKEIKRTGLRRLFLTQLYETQDAILKDADAVETIVLAYTWCCNAVHYGSLPYDFVTDWIIMHVIKVRSDLFTDINLMKQKFEAFLVSELKTTISVDW